MKVLVKTHAPLPLINWSKELSLKLSLGLLAICALLACELCLALVSCVATNVLGFAVVGMQLVVAVMYGLQSIV